MRWNSSTKIKAEKGPWLVMLDYHTEGFHIEQFDTLEEAVKEVMSGRWGTESAIAYLPDVDFSADLKAVAKFKG